MKAKAANFQGGFWLAALVAAFVGSPLPLVGCKPATGAADSPATPQAIAVQIEEKADPVAALASLTDPEKLRTLKPAARGINGRLDKVLYWLFVAEQKGIPPARAVDLAFERNGSGEPRQTLAKKQILANYASARMWGMFTPENWERLKRGNAGLVTKGSFIGQIVEVDHTVPVSRYPEFANELANLQLMPAMQNRAKGNRMGAAEFAKLQELRAIQPGPVTNK